MEYWLNIFVCVDIVIAEMLGIFIAAMLIQGIVYWTTGFSIYNYLAKKLITDQLN